MRSDRTNEPLKRKGIVEGNKLRFALDCPVNSMLIRSLKRSLLDDIPDDESSIVILCPEVLVLARRKQKQEFLVAA
jgi:hypothetical protein